MGKGFDFSGADCDPATTIKITQGNVTLKSTFSYDESDGVVGDLSAKASLAAASATAGINTEDGGYVDVGYRALSDKLSCVG